MRPILFQIGNFPIRSYGTLLVIGFLLAVWRTTRVCARRMETEPEGSPRRLHPDMAFDIALWGLMFGLLGARLLYVALDWKSFAGNPIGIFRIWEGGLSLHGGMLFGILYLVFYCRRMGLQILPLADLGAPAWALAYAFGRVGCFLNGCCYGTVCDLPWAVRFVDEQKHLTPPSHPIQLYASLINLVFFVWLTRWEKRPHRDGELFFGYLAMYGTYRGVMEFLRAGATSTFIPGLPLTDTHLVSLLMVMIGIGGIVWLRRNRPAVQDAVLPNAKAAKV